ncbi:hypothetical protein GCM10010191_91090 [Actinomadura vinacea]|uniref:Uncharacterized protein n=1 Tax=Actinomadura vinacea TaxID=115336 RepID=A0ABN3KDZ6_9ACTN
MNVSDIWQHPVMAATAADYAWFEERFPDLAEAYCLTLVRGLSPPQVLARLGARTNGPHVTGIERLPALDLPAAEQLIAVTLIEDVQTGTGTAGTGPPRRWALAVEPNGRLGVTEEAIVPLSAGTRLVSHFSDINAIDRFYWLEDGEVRLTFQPPSPGHREGQAPDEPLEAMRTAGFDIDGGDPASSVAAAFALAEHLTGVRVTPETLSESSFLCGVAPHP